MCDYVPDEGGTYVPDDDNAELLRLDHRNRLERQPLTRDSSLGAALRKVPGRSSRDLSGHHRKRRYTIGTSWKAHT